MRNRGYFRQMRLSKIRKRKEKIKAVGESRIAEDGYLAKGHSGCLSLGKNTKTNTRKGHASYRHKGAYGEANKYTKHDQQQIDAMNYEEAED